MPTLNFHDINIQAAIIGAVVSAIVSTGFNTISYFLQRRLLKNKILDDLIQEIETKAIAHWCCDVNDSTNTPRSIEIQCLITTLNRKIYQKDQETRDLIGAFRKKITDGDFADGNRAKLTYEDPRIEVISHAATALRSHLKIT